MGNIGIQREVKRSVYSSHRRHDNHNNHNKNDRIVDLAGVGDSSDDDMNGSVGVLTQNGFVYYVVEQYNNNDDDETIAWEVDLNNLLSDDATTTTPSPLPTTNNSSSSNPLCHSTGWFNLTYVEPNFIALHANGSIISISIATGVAEVVGEFENGVRAASWNDDRSVLVLVTSILDEVDDDMDVMADDVEDNKSDDQSKDIPIHRSEVPQQRHSVLLSLNTAWDVMAETRIDRIDEEQPVSLCWTTSQLAVNAVDVDDQMRKIRIYSSDTLELLAIGRTEDGSGTLVPNLQYSQMTWAGTGCSHLLTVVQRKGRTKTMVAFFEPNGLRHREFLLREDDTVIVTGLQWNSKSDLLAVALQCRQPQYQQQQSDDASSVMIQKVQLWYRSNYHWYMKYEFRYHQDMPVITKFHHTNPYILYICVEQLRWNVIHVRWDVCTKQISTTALSVDGHSLNMTDFDQAFVPPPMYAHTVTMNAPIQEIVTCQRREERSSSTLYGIASLSDATFVTLQYDEGKLMYPSIGSTVRCVDAFHFDVTSFRHLTIIKVDDTQLYVIAIGTSWDHTNVDFLLEIIISDEIVTIAGSHPLDQQCLTISTCFDSPDTSALVQLLDGSLLEYSPTNTPWGDTFGGNLTPCAAVESLLEPCPWVQCQFLDNNHHQSRLVIGMSSNGRLYCNDFQITDAISSFTISSENQFLSFATSGSGCVLRFIPLLDLINFDPLLGSDENSILLGYEPRNVERGSLLVSVLANTPSVVLQMPRGNLEIIHPRALVLRHAMLKTMDMHYNDAFQLMRRQKVDLNLIVDMNPLHFLESSGVTSFIEQVENIDYLNLFISGLQDWDSTKERYPIPHWINPPYANAFPESRMDVSSKVNLVCTRIRNVMILAQEEGRTEGGRVISEDHFLLPILSTFAKENPPKLEDALVMIRDNANRKHSLSSKKPPMFSDTAQSSIQYLAFMADYELLFQTALGLYDYDMARAVARNSQMDPKVYLPLLQRYRSLPLYFGRYQVDTKLKRFESALRNLHESKVIGEIVNINDDNGQQTHGNDFSDFLRLVEVHKQHRVGLEVCIDKEQRDLIFLSLGNQLLTDKKPQTALMVFLSATTIDEELCIRAAKECKDWSTLFSLQIVAKDEQRKQRLAWEIAEDLAAHAETNHNTTDILADASRVLLDYGNDLGGAVRMLIRGEVWFEARRIAILHSRDDLARKVIDAAVAYAQNVVADLEDRTASFAEASTRFDAVLAIRKAAMSDAGIDSGAILEDGDDASLFSAVSNASNLSMRSTASVGSTSSLSSVISVKSTNSFSLAGGEESNRHKSKYNSLGGQKSKKPKKKSKASKRIQPGSEEDLLGLVQTLKSNLVDEKLLLKIRETITFLIHTGYLEVARAVHDSYDELEKAINNGRNSRIEPPTYTTTSGSYEARRNPHMVEAEVASLEFAPLSVDILDVFACLPPP